MSNATVPQLSLLLLALGVVTVGMLIAGNRLGALALLMFGWGALNSAMPVAWFYWLTQAVHDELKPVAA